MERGICQTDADHRQLEEGSSRQGNLKPMFHVVKAVAPFDDIGQMRIVRSCPCAPRKQLITGITLDMNGGATVI